MRPYSRPAMSASFCTVQGTEAYLHTSLYTHVYLSMHTCVCLHLHTAIYVRFFHVLIHLSAWRHVHNLYTRLCAHVFHTLVYTHVCAYKDPFMHMCSFMYTSTHIYSFSCLCIHLTRRTHPCPVLSSCLDERVRVCWHARVCLPSQSAGSRGFLVWFHQSGQNYIGHNYIGP